MREVLGFKFSKMTRSNPSASIHFRGRSEAFRNRFKRMSRSLSSQNVFYEKSAHRTCVQPTTAVLKPSFLTRSFDSVLSPRTSGLKEIWRWSRSSSSKAWGQYYPDFSIVEDKTSRLVFRNQSFKNKTSIFKS